MCENRKNILVLTPYWPTRLKPGRGSFIINQVEALKKLGYNVDILILERKSVRSLFSRDNGGRLCDKDVKVYRYYSILKFNFFDQLYYHFLLKYRIDHDFAYHYIFCHTLSPLGAVIARNLSGQYKVLFTHGSDYRKTIKKSVFEKFLLKSLTAGFNKIAAPTPQMLSEINSSIDGLVFPNMIGEAFTSELLYSLRSIDLLFVGRLTKDKGFDLFIKCIESLKCEFPRLRVQIIGTGPLIHIVPSWVEYIPFVKPSLMPNIMEKCDILVLPSVTEAFGMVLAEAQARGCRVVTTRSGGPESVVMHQDSVIDEVSEIALYSRLRAFLLCKPTDIYRQAIQDFALARFAKIDAYMKDLS